MLCAKHPAVRNSINLADPTQIRTLKRRLGISGADLRRIVEKSGESIAATTKEVESERLPTSNDASSKVSDAS